jgi:hypothetical protein
MVEDHSGFALERLIRRIYLRTSLCVSHVIPDVANEMVIKIVEINSVLGLAYA